MANDFTELKKSFQNHRHTGSDTFKVRLQDIDFTQGGAVTAPTGGATVDSQARTAINDIITRLEELGLIAEN